MKMTIKWRYPKELNIKVHTRNIYDVDPKSIVIANGALFFTKTDGVTLCYAIDHIVRMEMEEE